MAVSSPAEQKTVLLTGGAGFIGSRLVHHASAAGYRVVNIDKLTYAGDLRNIGKPAGAYRFVHGDIADAELVNAVLVEEAPHLVFHLAAETHVDRSIDSPENFMKTNLLGTFNLLEAALNVRKNYDDHKRAAFRFIHVSTDEVFGALGPDGAFDETTGYDPSSPYSASKAGSDHLARAWQRTYGLPVIVTNCSNNYGPCQHREKLIPTIIRSALQREPIPLYGDGRNVRDWIYVDDHVLGLMRAAIHGTPDTTYLFGGGNERTNREICAMVCAALDKARPMASGARYDSLLVQVPDRPGHDFRYAVDSSHTQARLRWHPQTSLADGIRQTVDWYLAHPERLAGDCARRGLAGGATLPGEKR